MGATECAENGRDGMRETIRHYAPVAGLLAGIAAAGVLLTALLGGGRAKSAAFTVVTTNYPLYVAAQQLTVGVDGVAVENLTGASTGCLHDYQLSPANRITLERASLVLLNGAGAEPFLADVLPTLTAPVTDTSAGIALLPSGEAHEHEEQDDHDHDEGDDGHDDHHDHHHTYNEHVWVSPGRYAQQVTAAEQALCAADPDNAARYRRNGETYRRRIDEAAQRLRAAADALGQRQCVLFHDSLAYLTDELGFSVAVSLSAGEESGVSAGDLQRAADAVQADPTALILYDDQYTVRYPSVDRLVPENQVLALDTGVKGSGSADDWLRAMEQTAQALERCAAAG